MIKQDNIPEHIAIIMDGNGRWAKKQGALNRVFGHKNAITSVRDSAEECARLGVKYLTLYAFSTENWNRPKHEVDALMTLLVGTIRSETETLTKNEIKLESIGDISHLPAKCQKELREAKEITKDNKRMTLTLALNYGARHEIIRAVQNIANEVANNNLEVADINEALFSSYLYTDDIPDPELLIRTSGEMRISNFLLWQIAYSELYITDVLWPDFRKEHLHEAIASFQSRERRFGKTSEQITN